MDGKKPQLKLLYGGKAKHVTITGVKISVVPTSLHPLPVEVPDDPPHSEVIA